MSRLKQLICATSLFALASTGSAFAGLEGGVPGQGNKMPEATDSQISEACTKIAAAINGGPGFTVIAKGHPEFPDLKDLKIGQALKASCKISDTTWNKPPSHNWKSPEGRSLYTRKDLMPFVGDATVMMLKKSSNDPAYKKLFQDDPVVADDLQKLIKIVLNEAVEIDPKAPAKPATPRRIPHAKDAGVLPATPEQIAAACKRMAAGIPKHPGLTYIFKGFEKVKDYTPDDILQVFEQSCGDIVTEAAKNAPPVNPQITQQTLIADRDNACEKLEDRLLNKMDPDRAGFYAILDKDDYTRQTFEYVCRGGLKPGTEEQQEPIDDLDTMPEEPADSPVPSEQNVNFSGSKNAPVPAI